MILFGFKAIYQFQLRLELVRYGYHTMIGFIVDPGQRQEVFDDESRKWIKFNKGKEKCKC